MGRAKELSAAERESIARKLFTVKEHMTGRGELHGLCPFHDDSNPSFGYNYEKDFYNCLSCSASGDLIKLWSHVCGSGNEVEDYTAFCSQFNLPIHRSCDTGQQRSTDHTASEQPPADPFGDSKTKHVADQTGSGTKSKDIPQAVLTAAWEKMVPLPSAWRKRLSESRGWSESAMQQLSLRMQTCRWDKKIGALVDVREADRIAIPVFDADGTIKNIRCYKPGDARVKIFSFGPGCGGARLFPAVPTGDGIVLLCEGEGDTICAISNGFNAITQTSKTKYWSAEHTTPFKDRDVVIAYDADQAGEKYARFAAISLFKIARSVRVLVWPDWMGRCEDGQWPEDHGKDLTDFFVKHKKTSADLKLLVDTADLFKPEDDCICNPMEFFDFGPGGRLSFKPRMLADRICQKFALISDPESGLVYRWNGSFFERYPEEHIEKSCLEYLGDESQQSRAKDATFQAKRLSQVPFGRSLNDQDDWICIKNGMLNMRTLELCAHDKKFLSTYQLPVTFDPDRETKCERFLQYLEETIQTPGPIAQVQEFAGYCLTREVCYEKALLALGPGGDGKSKLISLLRALAGPENCSAVSFDDLEDQFHRSSLFGKMLNISTEIGSYAIESQYFKAITSGDPINAAYKHQDVFEFRPYCKLVFAGNRMPRIKDTSDGPVRRLLPIQFKRQFLEDDADRDPHLEEKLMAELSEIFQWALVGLHRLWQQKRFTDCDETRRLLMEFRRHNNPVLCFVEDACVLGEHQEAEKEKLYKSYKKYTGENGYMALGAENFFRELYSAVANIKQSRPRQKDGSRPRYISGIGVNEEVANG